MALAKIVYASMTGKTSVQRLMPLILKMRTSVL